MKTIFGSLALAIALLCGGASEARAQSGHFETRHEVVTEPGRFELRTRQVYRPPSTTYEVRTVVTPGRWVQVPGRPPLWIPPQARLCTVPVTQPGRLETVCERVWVPGRARVVTRQVWVPERRVPELPEPGPERAPEPRPADDDAPTPDRPLLDPEAARRRSIWT